MNKRKIFSLYSVVFGIGLLMAMGVCSSKNMLSQSTSDMIKILSDAFLLPAAMLCGLGGLIFISNTGSFNMMVYGTKSFFYRIFKRDEFLERYGNYYEYNKEKAKERAPFSYILIPGILFMILAVLFSTLYLMYYS